MLENCPVGARFTSCHRVAAAVLYVMFGRHTATLYRRVTVSFSILWCPCCQGGCASLGSRTTCTVDQEHYLCLSLWSSGLNIVSGCCMHSHPRGDVTPRISLVFLIIRSQSGVILRNQGWIFESLIRPECSLVSFLFSTPPPLSPQQDSFAPKQIKSKQILGRRDPTNSTTIKVQALNANGLFRVGIVMEPFYHHVWAPYFLHSSIKEVKMLLLNSRLWRLKNSTSLPCSLQLLKLKTTSKCGSGIINNRIIWTV